MDLKVKRKQDPCQPPPRGVDSCRQLRWWDVMWHFPASPQPEFTFLSPSIIFISWKNTPLAIVLPCDTQAAEQSLCHTVSSHCPLSCLPVALADTGIAAFVDLPSLPAQGAGSDSQCWGAHTLLSPALFLFSSLGSGSGFAVALFHRRALKPQQ